MIASGARHALNYVKETSHGVIPNTPAMTALRYTACSLDLSRQTMQSNELRSDRQITSVRTGTDSVAGDIDFELSFSEYDPLLEAALFGTWVDDKLKAGSDAISFSLERGFEDIGQYSVYTGCYVNTVSLSLKPSSLVTGKLNFVGLTHSLSTTPLADSVTAPQSNEVYDSFTGTIKEGDTNIGIVTGLDFNLNNNITPQYVLMKRAAAFVVPGRSILTGTLTAFFEDASLNQKFLQETPTSLEFTLGDGLTNSYTFIFPQVRYTSFSAPVNSEGPIALNLGFSAIFDQTSGTNVIIKRINAVSP